MDDAEAIKQLKARYCRLMDTKDWVGLSAVFTDDVMMDTTDSGGSVISGADDFLVFLIAAIGDVITVHQCHTPEIRDHVGDYGDWDVGDGRHAPIPGWLGAPRLRPLSRALREDRGQWLIKASTLTRLRLDFTTPPTPMSRVTGAPR